MADLLDDQQLHAAMADRPHWEVRSGALVRSVQAPTFLEGIGLVDSVARVAEDADHHPDIDIRWTTVTFMLSTHSEGGITDADVAMAKTIDDLVDQVLPPT
ncbi:MAG: 4a-hydroxytetrahydrobiopterin dehydratase [Nocardioidaceae bacterium]